jgi:PAS domain S-box-containing protein
MPFILFTGKGREEVVIEALNNGADFYMQKGAETRAVYSELGSKIRFAVSRHRAEKALRLDSFILNHIDEAVVAADMTGKIIFWNKAAGDLYGIPKSEAIGQPRTELLLSRRKDIKYIWGREAPGGHWRAECVFHRPDGKEVVVQTSHTSIVDEKKKPRATVSVSVDITERIKHQEELRELLEIMRYIVKHDWNAIAVYDEDLHYIAVSDRYLHDYGVKEEDIIGKHHYEVFPEMPQKWKDVHQRCLRGASERNLDDFFDRPDGTRTRNKWECIPWYRKDGTVGGIITYTEVTAKGEQSE